MIQRQYIASFASRQLASSNSHHTGAEAMNKPTYFLLFLVIKRCARTPKDQGIHRQAVAHPQGKKCPLRPQAGQGPVKRPEDDYQSRSDPAVHRESFHPRYHFPIKPQSSLHL